MEYCFLCQICLAAVMSQCMHFHMYTYYVKFITSVDKMCSFLRVA